jgi:ATP-dependent protease ClpP protease subunit
MRKGTLLLLLSSSCGRCLFLPERRIAISSGLLSALSSSILTSLPEREDGVGKEEESLSPRIDFYGEVTQESCYKLAAGLRDADSFLSDQEEKRVPIHLHIQSYGGDLMPMLFLLDVMDDLESPVWTFVDGYAGSSASLLSVSGQRRFMTKRSFLLIHELRTGMQGGTYSDLISVSHHTTSLMRQIRDVYVSRTSLTDSDLDSLFRTDIWLGPKECLDFGIVDSVL